MWNQVYTILIVVSEEIKRIVIDSITNFFLLLKLLMQIFYKSGVIKKAICYWGNVTIDTLLINK